MVLDAFLWADAACHSSNVPIGQTWHSHADYVAGGEHSHPVSLFIVGTGSPGSLSGKVAWLQEASADFGKTELWWQARRAMRRHQIAMGFGLGAMTGGTAYLLKQPRVSAQKATASEFLERRSCAQQWNKQQQEQQQREQQQQEREQQRRKQERRQESSEEPLIWMEISESSDNLG
mmetsp:Transcript_107770/g.214151  ORF Transcript_107770/g.214151 Transcript_107770/m.214151 type:complete len:176 (-) Transcript_107770:167-694(-)